MFENTLESEVNGIAFPHFPGQYFLSFTKRKVFSAPARAENTFRSLHLFASSSLVSFSSSLSLFPSSSFPHRLIVSSSFPVPHLSSAPFPFPSFPHFSSQPEARLSPLSLSVANLSPETQVIPRLCPSVSSLASLGP